MTAPRATEGTLRAVELDLPGGRVLRATRLEYRGRGPQLLLAVGFRDGPGPLAEPEGIRVPMSVAPELRGALLALEEEEG